MYAVVDIRQTWNRRAGSSLSSGGTFSEHQGLHIRGPCSVLGQHLEGDDRNRTGVKGSAGLRGSPAATAPRGPRVAVGIAPPGSRQERTAGLYWARSRM